MADLLIADTLLSENKSIDAMINFTLKHSELSSIIICGKGVKDHRGEQVLLALIKNGISSSGSIIGAASRFAILESSAEGVDALRVK